VAPYSEAVGRDTRAQPITSDGSLLVYDPYRRVLLLQISNSSTGITGSYSAFTVDTVKGQWSGFSLGGVTSGWTLGASALGTSTILAGGNATITSGVVSQASDGTLRLYVGGQDNNGVSLLRSWGKGNAIDGAIAFTAKVRARRTFGPGKRATVWAPTLYYRNPQGSTAGSMTCTVTLVRNYDEMRSQSFVMDTTTDDNGISVVEKSLESLACADVSVLDAVIELVYSGTTYNSVVTPTIDALVVPFKVQEAVAR
jgi:hypothetical protein